MTGRRRQARWAAAGAACAVVVGVAAGPAPARAEPGAEVAGRVTDGTGRPIAGADVVITDPGGRQRRSDVTGSDGRFHLRIPGAGARRIAVYTERGARVVVSALEVAPGARLWLEAADAGGHLQVRSFLAPGQVPWPGPVPGRGDDLAGLLAGMPGTAPASAPVDGPTLLGTDPAEAQVRLDGFLLNDPVDGRAPWDLPAAFFAAAVPAFGLGPARLRQTGMAAVALAAPRPERPLQAALAVSGGLAAPAGEAQGPERPAGRSGAAFTHASLGLVRRDGEIRGHLALAPAWGPFEADPESPSAMRGRRPRRFPVLGGAEVDLARWNLSAVGLGNLSHLTHGRASRIVPPRDPAASSSSLWLVGATARRAAAAGPGELALSASLLRTGRAIDFQGDLPSRTTAYRSTLAAQVSTDGTLLGRHLLEAGAGLDASWARRPTREPSRQAGLLLAGSRGSSYLPWLALDERYRPRPEVELELGVRFEKAAFSGRAEPEAQPAIERSFSTGLLIAPRAQACYQPGPGRICLAAGRFGGGLPLAPLLDATAAPPVTADAPAEDAVLAQAELRLGPLGLAAHALDRRTAHTVEDRFSPVTGTLELHEPRGLRRRMLAAGLSAWLSLARTRIAAGVLASRLRGNHVGFLDAGTGQVRPAGTAEWDTPAAAVNRDGALPFDRPWSGRLLLEHRQPLGAMTLDLLALGRWDAGTPLSARARSPESGPSQVFLVQRGSLGRTSATASLDLRVGLSRRIGDIRLALLVEGFNLTGFRPVVAREQTYTDAAVAPRQGASGRAALEGLTDGEGNPLPPRAGFGNPVAWAEPLLVRLGLAVEL